jgi:hypothetical protein
MLRPAVPHALVLAGCYGARFSESADDMRTFSNGAISLAAACLLTACMLQRTEDLSSAATAAADRATLQCGDVCGVISNIDTDQSFGVAYEEGLLMNEGVGDVILDPGNYLVSVLTHGKYTPWDQAQYSGFARFTAEPGRVYAVKRDCDTGWFGGAGDRWYVWIEDRKTGQAVGGKKPP